MIRNNTEFGIRYKKKGEGPPKKKKELLEDRSMSMDSDQIEDELYHNKRILLKVMKFRSNPLEALEPEAFKTRSIQDIGANDKIKDFRGQINKNHEELLSRGSKRSRKLSENLLQSARAKSDCKDAEGEEDNESMGKDSLQME
jgi:hypothetical protein